MPRMLYSDSYGGIASQEMARDQARASRYFQSLAEQRALDQMAAQRQQQAQSQRWNALTLLANQRQAEQSRRMQEQNQALNLAKLLQDDQQARARQDFNEAAYDDQANENDFRTALDLTLQGKLNPPTARAAFGRLPEEYQKRLASVYQASAEQEKAMDMEAGNQADVLNNLALGEIKKKARATLGPAPTPSVPWYKTPLYLLPGVDVKANDKRLSEYETQVREINAGRFPAGFDPSTVNIEALKARYNKDRTLQSLVGINPENPLKPFYALPQPRMFSSPMGDTNRIAGASAPITAPANLNRYESIDEMQQNAQPGEVAWVKTPTGYRKARKD